MRVSCLHCGMCVQLAYIATKSLVKYGMQDVAAAAISATKATAASATSFSNPKTSHDFKKAYRCLKSNAASASEYIAAIPITSYQSVFKADLDKEILDAFAVAFDTRQKSDKQWCQAALASLKSVDRFDTMHLMASKQTKATLASVGGPKV